MARGYEIIGGSCSFCRADWSEQGRLDVVTPSCGNDFLPVFKIQWNNGWLRASRE